MCAHVRPSPSSSHVHALSRSVLPPPGAAAAASHDHAVAINNADVSAEYVIKLRHELEAYAERVFAGQGDRERTKSVLSDLTKTGGDFTALATRALESLSDALLPRLRPVLDEVGTVSEAAADMDMDCCSCNTWGVAQYHGVCLLGDNRRCMTWSEVV